MKDKVVSIKLDVDIDEPIANLIIELNRNHLSTRYCCCGHETTNAVIHSGEHEIVQEIQNTHPCLYITFAKYELTEKFCNYVQTYFCDGKIISNVDYYTLFKPKSEFSSILTNVKIVTCNGDNTITIYIHYKHTDFYNTRQRVIDFMTYILKQFIKNEFGF